MDEQAEIQQQWYRTSLRVGNTMFYQVEFDKPKVEINTVDLERCIKCQGYLNCYTEIIAPGTRWTCNMCGSENVTDKPFTYLNNSYRGGERIEVYNKATFDHPALTNNIYELEAPEGFNLKSTDAPTLIFNIEVTIQAQKNELLEPLLTSIKDTLRTALNEGVYDIRTRVAFLFFNDNLFVLNRNKTFTVITAAMPQILKDEVTFSLYEDIDVLFSLFDDILKYFSNIQSNGNCLLQSVQFISSVFKSGTIFTFLSSMPNTGSGALKESNTLIENETYKKVAQGLNIKALSFNLFMCTKQTLEFAQFRSLIKTGGQVFHYTNFDGGDSTYTAKLYADLNELVNNDLFYNCLMRIRVSEGNTVRQVFGNNFKRNSDLFAIANYNPKHSISFEIQGETRKYTQIAMVRVRKNGLKTIRIATFYHENELGSTEQIALGYMQIALEKEFNKQGTGDIFLDQTLKSFINGTDSLLNRNELALYFSAYKKNLVLDKSISSDFRAYYNYLFTNSSIAVCDKITYPRLYDLYGDGQYLSLTKNSINDGSIYILDAGINIYIFIGRDNVTYTEYFDGEITSGVCLLDNIKNTEQGNFLTKTLEFFTATTDIKPKYLLILDSEQTPLSEIFRKHLYDDSIRNKPDAMTYYNSLLNN